MLATVNGYNFDLLHPIDISLPLTANGSNPIAWYLDQPQIEPVTMGSWVGKVSEGSSTNFNNIQFNPHAHGTHTECLGHITKEFYSVNRALKRFFFVAELISVTPESVDNDLIITRSQIESALNGKSPEAIVIRTLPNNNAKQHKNYSNSNPPYLEEAAATYIRELGIEHLLIDLPSVDKEKDDGLLLAHKAFWNVKDVNNLNADARHSATITEMVFIPDTVLDGTYLLNLQIASFENDASPSKPILYSVLDF
ncbi:cyclase family protein [Flavobacterium sp. Sd200]|uniref:cyclase family protein n=1 Tax=Flavobacterium sp. Sd200 TaxID=2692211 RepID=UPI00136889F5|nr:cyclase family protein [Flavobacterium sp. Sd200]MXN92103.1 cyclase family protein [Flavobacterium sp. Sd200]